MDTSYKIKETRRPVTQEPLNEADSLPSHNEASLPQKEGDEGSQDSLQQLYLAFAQMVLESARAYIQEHGLTRLIRPKPVFFESGARLDYVEVADYHSLLLNQAGWLGDRIDECCGAHWEQGVIKQSNHQATEAQHSEYPTYKEMKHSVYLHLVQPLISLVDTKGTLELSEEEIVQSYLRYREAWMAEGVGYTAMIPLLNFVSDVGEASLGPKIKLAPFSLDEKTEMWVQSTASSPLLTMPVALDHFVRAKFKLTGEHSQPQSQPHVPPEDIFHEWENIVTALRLLKRGSIQAPFLLDITQIVWPWRDSAQKLYVPDFYAVNHSGQFVLSAAELAPLQHLIDALEKLPRPKQGGLRLALQRFNRSYTRPLYEDRLIDLTIALESTLLAGEGGTELKFRLIMRGAALLSAIHKPEDTKKNLGAMYDARSSIVHEGLLLSDPASSIKRVLKKVVPSGDTAQFVQICEDMVRDVLKEYLLRIAQRQVIDKSVENLSKGLDDEILNSLLNQQD